MENGELRIENGKLRMERHYEIRDLSPHLFWDVNVEEVDWEANQAWFVKRVLEYGLMKDWEIIKAHYGLDRIKEISKNLRTLDVVAFAFLLNIFEEEKENFRCYTQRQLNPTHWNS